MRAFVRLLHVLKLPGGRGKKAEKERENEEMGEEDIFSPPLFSQCVDLSELLWVGPSLFLLKLSFSFSLPSS